MGGGMHPVGNAGMMGNGSGPYMNGGGQGGYNGGQGGAMGMAGMGYANAGAQRHHQVSKAMTPCNDCSCRRKGGEFMHRGRVRGWGRQLGFMRNC